ncbi:hypothetical protein QQF64_007969 [Cirrhinus molitorella]|uniref:Uncharacterized protein n=1 Tax=Cirrhinus molitorella TaxID=172907 RepID=A0ABR3M8D1_9TELE
MEGREVQKKTRETGKGGSSRRPLCSSLCVLSSSLPLFSSCAPRACPLTSLIAPTIKKHAHQRTTLKPTTHPKSPTPDTAHSHLCFRFVCFVCASFSRSVSVSGLSLPHCVEMSRTTDPVGHWEDLEAWLSAMTDSLLPKAAETLRHQTQDQLGDSLTSIMKHDHAKATATKN